MGSKIKQWFLINQDLLILNLILLIKVLVFTSIYVVGQTSFWLIVSTLAVLFAISSWMVMLPSLVRQGALLLFDLLMTLVLVSDSLFERYFHRVLPIPALYQANQLNGISKSIAAILNPIDFLFIADLILIVPFLAYVHVFQRKHPIKLRFRAIQSIVVIVFCVGLVFLGMGNISKAYGSEAISDIYMNNTLLNTLGVLNFHVADAFNTFKGGQPTKLSRRDLLTLQGWNVAHQLTQTKLQGAAKGLNLIMVQMESMQNFLIGKLMNGQEITPNLNKLIKSSMYFDNYFVQVSQGNSSDAEFMAFNSLYPTSTGVSFLKYANNNFNALPKLLKDKGYHTFVIHGDIPTFWGRDLIYPKLGIEQFISRNELKNDSVIGMGLSDESVFKQSADIIEKLQKPYMSMIITLSGHHPFEIPKSQQELNVPEGQYSKLFSDYLQSQHYADKQFGLFLDRLEADGILDTSVLVVYGDHFGSGWEDNDIENFTGINDLNEYQQMELKKVPLFIRMPNAQNAGIQHQSGGQMDLMPTLANLFGLERQKVFFFGQDLINKKDGWTIFRFYAPDGSFATDDYIYLGNWDGVYTDGHTYDRKTGKPVSVEVTRSQYNEAKEQLRLSDRILDTNNLSSIISKK